jgi:hypothetical protein
MVDYIVGENPTNASAAGQLKSLATASTSSLLLRNSKARHNNFLRARSLACYNIFLFLIKRAIILANAFLSLSTFFWYSFWVLSKDVYDKLTHARLRYVYLEHFKRDLGIVMQLQLDLKQRLQGIGTMILFLKILNTRRS